MDYLKQDATCAAETEKINIVGDGDAWAMVTYNWDKLKRLPYTEQPRTAGDLKNPKYKKFRIVRMIEN